MVNLVYRYFSSALSSATPAFPFFVTTHTTLLFFVCIFSLFYSILVYFIFPWYVSALGHLLFLIFFFFIFFFISTSSLRIFTSNLTYLLSEFPFNFKLFTTEKSNFYDVVLAPSSSFTLFRVFLLFFYQGTVYVSLCLWNLLFHQAVFFRLMFYIKSQWCFNSAHVHNLAP